MGRTGTKWITLTDGLAKRVGSEDAVRPNGNPRVRLLVDDIRVRGSHGVYEEERAAGNDFSIDIELNGNFTCAIQSDRIDDSVDIDRVVTVVRNVNRQNQFHLIESFADAIACALLLQFPILSCVFVRVKKLTLARLESVRSSAAEITRCRP